MGFRDYEAFNDALLTKQFRGMMNSPSAFWVQVLKGIYFPNTTCMEAIKGASPSWLWNSLLVGRDLLEKGLKWNVEAEKASGSGEINGYQARVMER